MTTFRFNLDGELVASTASNVSAFPALPPITSLDGLLALQKQVDRFTGRSSDLFVHPDHCLWPDAVASQESAQAGASIQRMEDRIRSGVLDSMMRIVVDPYAPRTVRRQVRFPRSKKRRIRRKWAKDPRNWREFDCAWLVDTDRLRNSKVIAFSPVKARG